jgi:Glycosyltransferase family 10 (fucosyltransferase) C-term
MPAHDKLGIRRFSAGFGEPDDAAFSTSHRNTSQYVRWVLPGSAEPYDLTIYFDGRIKDAFDDPAAAKIGWLLETRELNEEIILKLTGDMDRTRRHFAFIFTLFDDLLALGAPFAYTIPNAVPWVHPQNRRVHDKIRLVSMVASSKSELRGHKRRLEWVEKLKDKVDLYGRGRENELEDKDDGLIDYMFTVAIENDDTVSYFTEKITDAFSTGTVPVYWGSRRAVEKYFDTNGIIFLEDDPDLSSLSAEKYARMMPHIKANYDAVMRLPVAEDYLYQRYLRQIA